VFNVATRMLLLYVIAFLTRVLLKESRPSTKQGGQASQFLQNSNLVKYHREFEGPHFPRCPLSASPLLQFILKHERRTLPVHVLIIYIALATHKISFNLKTLLRVFSNDYESHRASVRNLIS
jgi:hypothetical protein